jgi:hypothetical protein
MLTRIVRGSIAAALVATGATVALSASPAYACSVSTYTSTPAYMGGNTLRTHAQGSVDCSGTWALHHELYLNGRIHRSWSYTRDRAGTVYSTKDVSCVNGLFHSVVKLGFRNGYVSQSTSSAISIRC